MKTKKLTRVQDLMLYTLGKLLDETNKKVVGKPLSIALTKAQFIQMITDSEVAGKKERAVYQNLQNLEAKHYVEYSKKQLSLTAKGRKVNLKIERQIAPYHKVMRAIEEKIQLAREGIQTALE